jgi:hypothetical protein
VRANLGERRGVAAASHAVAQRDRVHHGLHHFASAGTYPAAVRLPAGRSVGRAGRWPPSTHLPARASTSSPPTAVGAKVTEVAIVKDVQCGLAATPFTVTEVPAAGPPPLLAWTATCSGRRGCLPTLATASLACSTTGARAPAGGDSGHGPPGGVVPGGRRLVPVNGAHAGRRGLSRGPVGDSPGRGRWQRPGQTPCDGHAAERHACRHPAAVQRAKWVPNRAIGCSVGHELPGSRVAEPFGTQRSRVLSGPLDQVRGVSLSRRWRRVPPFRRHGLQEVVDGLTSLHLFPSSGGNPC